MEIQCWKRQNWGLPKLLDSPPTEDSQLRIAIVGTCRKRQGLPLMSVQQLPRITWLLLDFSSFCLSFSFCEVAYNSR